MKGIVALDKMIRMENIEVCYGFFEAVSSVFSKYFEFSGRALRSEYWFFVLFTLLLSIPLAIISIFSPPFVYFLFLLGLSIPSWAVIVRRLHDSNHSGWWSLITLIPLVGWLILLYC